MKCFQMTDVNFFLSFPGHSSWKDESHRTDHEGAWEWPRRDGSSHDSLQQEPSFGNYLRRSRTFLFRFSGCCLNLICICVVSIKKSPSLEEEEQIGRWAAMVKQRSLQIVDLRREFQGWHGNHERHCILHDVFLGWTEILRSALISNLN